MHLRTTQYANGDSIPQVIDNASWADLSTGARCAYGNNFNNVFTYGRLYNYYAVTDDRGLCPQGWHVTTDAEMTELENHIGSQGFADNPGTALKSCIGWHNGGGGTDDFGFSGLPGGFRSDADGFFFGVSNEGYLWCSTGAWTRRLKFSDNAFFAYSHNHQDGFSVRCIQD